MSFKALTLLVGPSLSLSLNVFLTYRSNDLTETHFQYDPKIGWIRHWALPSCPEENKTTKRGKKKRG